MMRSLWFIAQILVLCAILLWASQHPGDITINWLNKNYSSDMGIVLAAFYIAILATCHIQNMWNHILNIPQILAHKRALSQKDKYLSQITQGLSELAAGNLKKAQKHSLAAEKIDSNEKGLLLLLQAQIAQKMHQSKRATYLLEKLEKDPSASFLATRIQIQNAAKNGDQTRLNQLTTRALTQNKNAAWLLQAAYKTAINSHNHTDALLHLSKLEKHKHLDNNTTKNDRLALLIALYDSEENKRIKHLKQALKLNDEFPPLIQHLRDHYKKHNNISAAKSCVKKAWKKAPHPQLAQIWMDIKPNTTQKTIMPLELLKWAKLLTAVNPDHFESYFLLGNICTDAALWGEARDYFNKAKQATPSALSQKWYRAMASLERKENQNENCAQEWLNKASQADIDPQWICTQSNRSYPIWTPYAQPHGSFNTIIWQEKPLINVPVIFTDDHENLIELTTAL